MARLLLIRHAPTPETGKKLTGRLPGVSLDEPGRELARGTAERLRSVRLAGVYTSPIERAVETAAEVAFPHRRQPVPDERLLEVNYGRWSGRTLASLRKLKAWQTVQVTPSRMRFPDGESLVEAQARGVAACEELAARHRRQTVALVTHADIIRAVISHYLGQPLDLFQRIGAAPTSVSVIDLPADGPPLVVAVNGNGDPSTWR